METQPQVHNSKQIFLALLGVVLLIFLALYFLVNQSLQKNKLQQAQTIPIISPIEEPKIGSMTIAATTSAALTAAKQTVLQVSATSDDHNIVGYDVVVSYDPTQFDFTRAQSLMSDFKVLSFKSEGYVTITGTKELTSEKQTVLVNTPIVNLTFTPKAQGTGQFALQPLMNREKTQLVDDQSNILHPEVNAVEVRQ